MNSKFLCSITLALAASSMATVNLFAANTSQADADAIQISKMYDKIRIAVAGPESDQKDKDGNKKYIISLKILGVPIRPGFSEANPKDLELLQEQFDGIPQKRSFYQISTLKYSDVYAHILNDRKLQIKGSLSKADLDKKKQLETDLDPSKDKYKNYIAAKQDVDTANNTLKTAKFSLDQANDDKKTLNDGAVDLKKKDLAGYLSTKATVDKEWSDATSVYNKALSDKQGADQRFLLAHGTDVEADLEKLYTYQNYNGEAWWGGLRTKFEAAKVTNFDLQFFPAPSEWNPAGSDQGAAEIWPDHAYAGLPAPIPAPPLVQGASDPISALAKAASQGIAGTASSGSATASSSAGASQPAATDQSTTDGTNESTTDAATPSPADTSDQPPANGSTASATPATSDPKPKVDPSWVHFKFNQMDIKKSTSSSADASMYSASYSTIFASASVGHSNSTQIQAVSNDDKSFELSFDLKLVSVFRPWMDMTIFRNNSWVIGRKIWSNEGPISYGNKDDIKDINPEPLMPVVITNIILARNISLKGTDLHIQDQAIQAASESHASANYFGFNMSGAKSHSSSTTDESKQGHITELRSDGVQIIGCVSTILPECPSK